MDLIVIPREDCTAKQGASFVLQDDDGTQADFIDNDTDDTDGNPENVQIRNTRDGLRVTGTGEPAGNITPLLERGGDGTLDTGGLTIVTSTDIRCEDDNTPAPNPDPDPDPNPVPGAGGCTTLATLSGSDQQTSDSFSEPEGSGQFRVAYETQDADGSLKIFVTTATESNTTVLSETVEGAGSDIITGEFLDTEAGYILSATPTDQQYRIVLQAVGGDDERVEPVAVDTDDDDKPDVMANTIPEDDELPDTGGPSLGVGVGLALVASGAFLIGGASLMRFRR